MHPLRHASCLTTGVHPQQRQLSFGVPLTGSPYYEDEKGCEAVCSAGYHLARCALGCVECRQDGVEIKAALILLRALVVCGVLIVAWLSLKRHLWDIMIRWVRVCFLDRNLTAKRAQNIGLTGEDCIICLAKFEPSELVRTLKCPAAGSRGHNFHADCIDRWLLLKSRCPICNADYKPLLHISSVVSEAEGW